MGWAVVASGLVAAQKGPGGRVEDGWADARTGDRWIPYIGKEAEPAAKVTDYHATTGRFYGAGQDYRARADQGVVRAGPRRRWSGPDSGPNPAA